MTTTGKHEAASASTTTHNATSFRKALSHASLTPTLTHAQVSQLGVASWHRPSMVRSTPARVHRGGQLVELVHASRRANYAGRVEPSDKPRQAARLGRSGHRQGVAAVVQRAAARLLEQLLGTSASKSFADYPYKVWSLLEMARAGIAAPIDEVAGACAGIVE